jgi:hypothetical protein
MQPAYLIGACPQPPCRITDTRAGWCWLSLSVPHWAPLMFTTTFAPALTFTSNRQATKPFGRRSCSPRAAGLDWVEAYNVGIVDQHYQGVAGTGRSRRGREADVSGMADLRKQRT